MSKRGQNEGSICLRKDGRWEGRINLGWRDGKRWRKCFYGQTRQAVREKMTTALHNQQMGLPIAPERLTVGQFLHRWLEDVVEPGTRPKTRQTYREIVENHLVPSVGKIILHKLSPHQVQALMNSRLKAGLSPRTVKHLRDTLRNALNVAVKWNLILRERRGTGRPTTGPQTRDAGILARRSALIPGRDSGPPTGSPLFRGTGPGTPAGRSPRSTLAGR